MNDEIKKIINSVFSVDDSKVIERLLEVIEGDINNSKRERLDKLERVLGEAVTW